MPNTEKRAQRPRTARLDPAPGTFAAQVRATVARLNLDDTRAAQYFGVPVPTFRKWRDGARAPSAAVVRLLDVLGTIEALAPSIHAALVPPKLAPEPRHVKKSRKVSPQDSVMSKNPLSEERTE